MDEYKSLSEIPAPERKRPKPLDVRSAIPRPSEKRLKVFEPEAQVDWHPVNAEAAKLLAKSPWQCKPPPPPPKFMKPTEFDEPSRVKTKRMLTEAGHVEELVSAKSVAPLALDNHEHTVKDGVKASSELIERSHDVIAAIDYLTSEIRGPWAEYQQFVADALKQVREHRIALGSETRLLMMALKEVRQFFLEDSYQTEIDRLHEFVDLCERLKALKEAGFLDALADTILKLDKAED